MIPGQTQSFLAGYNKGIEVSEKALLKAWREGFQKGYEKAMADAKQAHEAELARKRELIRGILDDE